MPNTSILGSFSDVSGSSLMFRNKLINGDMRIDQRNAGASQTFTASAALAYSVDRWYGYCTGANVTGQRVAGSGNTQFRYQFTGAASVTAIQFGQRIEAANAYSLAGQSATLSVDLSNSLLTTVTWTAYYANTADTFGSIASPTRTQIATGTFTVSSTLTRYSAQINIPTAATTGIEIVFSVGAQTSGTWVIGNAQLEAGTAPTAFENRFFNSELSLCQRYYEKSFALGTAPAANLGDSRYVNVTSYLSNDTVGFVYFKTQKRTNAVMTAFSAISTGSNWHYWTGSAFTAVTTTLSGFENRFSAGLAITATVGQSWLTSGHWTASAEL